MMKIRLIACEKGIFWIFVKRRGKEGCTKSLLRLLLGPISLTGMTSCRRGLFFKLPRVTVHPEEESPIGARTMALQTKRLSRIFVKKALRKGRCLIPEPALPSEQLASSCVAQCIYGILSVIYNLCDIWIPICYFGIQCLKLEPKDLLKGLS